MYALILLLVVVNGLAFWQRHEFLYLLSAVGDVTFGLYYAWQSDPFTGVPTEWGATFTVGVLVVLVGIFCVYRVAVKIWRR